MDVAEFLDVVGRMTGGDRPVAERATRATLATLAERIGADEARHLVPLLPPEIGAMLFTSGGARAFDVDEFVRRVADREQSGVDVPTAERHAAAVFTALARAISDTEFDHLRSRLPKDFTPLLPKGEYAGGVPAGEFFSGVAEHAGVDAATARRITGAVLETLAERIAGGEVDDLLSRLPVELHPPLERGKAHSGGTARSMPADEFVRRVAARADTTPERARGWIRAVFATLRRTLRDDEFFDITVQLPGEYWMLLAPAGG